MAKEKITGAEALMRSLEHEGVTTLFGYPGGAIMPVYDALYGYKDKLNHVLVRHEQGATHAAQGYARVSGKVGVALVTSGPGATNTITGIADAMMDSTPIVVIAGQVGASLLGCDATHQQMGLSDPSSGRCGLGGKPCLLYCQERQAGAGCVGLCQERAGRLGGL